MDQALVRQDRKRLTMPLVVLALSTVVGACGVEVVVQGLEEKEANRIVELLDASNINSVKQINATGRETTFSIAVPPGRRIDAIKLLNQHDLPVRNSRGYSEVFGESGLIPTAAEEKAKQLSAIEGEIERQLRLIEGVLDVEVQIVLPEDSPLRTTRDQDVPATASVTVRYLPGAGGTRPISEPEVKSLVAAGVEKLTPDNVVVVMRPGGALAAAPAKQGASPGDDRKMKMYKMGLVGAIGLVVICALLLIFTQLRLRNVRGRLIRLQGEIAKARRRPGEGSVAS